MLGREQGTYQMGIFQLLDDLYLVELDVEVLVDALERAADLNIVFQLDRDLVVDERLEEAIPSGERMCQLPNVCTYASFMSSELLGFSNASTQPL